MIKLGSLFICSFICSFIGITTSVTAIADPRNQYGWGIHDLANAGADRTGTEDAMTIAQNPATMTELADATWTLNFTGMNFQFPDLTNIQTDSSTVGDTSTTGNITVNPDPLYMLQIGTQAPFGKDKKWRFGFSFSAPVDKLVDVATADGYRPNMAFYGKPEARLTSVLGIAKELSDAWSIGLAGDLYFKTGATLNVRLPQAPTTSTLSFGATVKLAVAPQIGINFHPSAATNVSLNYLGARDYRQEVSATNLFYLLGTGNAGALQLGTTGSNFYDPETYSLGCKYDFNAQAKKKSTLLLAAIDYERWSPYDGTVAKITFSSFQSQFVQNANNIAFRDIIVPRVGVVFGDSVRYRAGYAYHQTPMIDLNGQSNQMDANKHIVAAGASFDIGTLGLFETSARMDLGAQVQLLVPRTVTKSDPTAIGYPGYTVSGTAYFYGIGLSHDI